MQDGEKQIKVRYELAGNDSKGLAQNNNKDTQEKQYALQEIVQGEGETWRIIFQLSGNSTPKAEIFQQMAQTIFGISAKECTPYLLADKDKKSLFNDLGKDHDKVQGGQVSGVGKLRITKDKYLEKLLSQAVFKKLATNNDARLDVLRHDPKAQIFHTLDQKLNLFFVGNDSDYFIHKDLKGFLTQEKDRFIKNIVFSSLDALLNAELNNETLSIAKAFHVVAERMIEMLHTIETFQKGLFEMKKWVLGTHYLISLGKINEVLTDETERTTVWNTILANTAQLTDWENTFGVKIANSMDLESINSLPLDTAHFDQAFTWGILTHFDDLEAATDGVLLNSENFQALNLLQERYRQRIKCIYIDPPYNTGKDEFIYKDSFRHSSWLSLMEDRLMKANQLLNDQGVWFISLDDVETHRLKVLTDQLWNNFFVNQICHKSRASISNDKLISPNHNNILLYVKDFEIIDKVKRQFGLKPNLEGFNLEDNIGKYKLVPVDGPGGASKGNPHYTFLGVTDYFRFSLETMESKYKEGKIVNVGNGLQQKYYRHEAEKTRQTVTTWWDDSLYTSSATKDLINILGHKNFNNPKHLKLLTKIVDLWARQNNDITLDFFAGSGTTGHAVMKLNREDGGRRKFILVEMGQYFDMVLKERIRRVMFSMNWKDGKPVKEKTEGYIGLVKYQKLAQYEDVLNNLETLTQTEDTPSKLPAGSHTLHYLYRPEVNVLHSSLDLSKPFGQTMLCGKDQTPFTLDLLETYCYLRGFSITKVQTYTLEDKTYQIISSGNRLVIFRDIEIGENDTKALKHILNDFPDATMLYVNHHAELLHLQDVNVSIEIIHADEFITGTTWE
jgi:adenine-specific DNA-methyltransferase